MNRRRYPLEPLFDVTGWTHEDVRRMAPAGGAEYRRRKTEGVSEAMADRLATRAGYHPWLVWPEMADHAIEDATAPAEPRKARDVLSVRCHECGQDFPTPNARRLYCSTPCRDRAADRRRGGAAARRARYHAQRARAAS